MEDIPTYSFIKALTFNQGYTWPAPDYFAQPNIILTIEDALVLGYYLAAITIHAHTFDDNAGTIYPISPDAGNFMQFGIFYASASSAGVLGDDMNLTGGGTATRNFLNLQIGQNYIFPRGLYVPGNEIRFGWRAYLDPGYVKNGQLQTVYSFSFQIGFAVIPEGSKSLTFTDKIIPPEDIESFGP